MASIPDAPRSPYRGDTAAATFQDSVRLPALHAFVSEARRCVVARLREWGAHEDVCGDAELVISELFTNAVLHTDSVEIGYGLRVNGRRLRVEVSDEGCRPDKPMKKPKKKWNKKRLRPAEADEEHGRGLLLVKSFAEAWGVRACENGRGKVTWADIPFRPAP